MAAAAAIVVGMRIGVGIYCSVSHSPQPVVPGDVAPMDQYRLIVAMVAYVLEEDTTAEGRDLQASNVDVGVEVAPCICADAVGYEGRKQAIEVEEEEDGQDAADEQLNQEDPAKISTNPWALEGVQYQLKPSRGFSGSATIPPAMVAARCGETAAVHHYAAQ